MTRILTAIIAFALLISCNKAEEPAQPPVKKAAKAAQQAPAGTIDMNAGTAGSIEDARRRNPFQSHIVLMKGAPAGSKKVKGPLECCEISTFKILAAVVGVNDSEGFALVQAPDAKRYVVRRGDVMGVNEGKVITINAKGIVVREHLKDEDGKIKSTEDIELKLLERKF
ncbi:MAG: pilus assembly protein PilP [Deltaproteobacteria bacterium]|nr:pilus assembly protein PilP [Deltaproteobacteria bacterium]